MPDIPLEIEGNAQEFTVHLPDVSGQRTFQAHPSGDGRLILSPNVAALKVVVTNGQGLEVVLPLGTGWKVIILDLAKPTPRAGGGG